MSLYVAYTSVTVKGSDNRQEDPKADTLAELVESFLKWSTGLWLARRRGEKQGLKAQKLKGWRTCRKSIQQQFSIMAAQHVYRVESKSAWYIYRDLKR